VLLETISAAWAWIDANSQAVQAVCIVLSAIAAFLVIWHNGRISRQAATIAMVRATFFEDGERESYNKFKEFIENLETDGQCISDFAEPKHDNSDANALILRQINNYELVSLGIKKGVFDERFYKRWFFSQLTRDFKKLKPYIDRVRECYHNDAYFCEFEGLAGRWDRKRHPVKHPPKWKVSWWVITGQPEKAQRALDTQ
jgi:hypothetical protein